MAMLFMALNAFYMVMPQKYPPLPAKRQRNDVNTALHATNWQKRAVSRHIPTELAIEKR
ncbi:MAG: hypothetical protein KF734_16895 [Saprospiraceae bacterium]|nr:hypothetical protein [Saprospiraceae bacterium]